MPDSLRDQLQSSLGVTLRLGRELGGGGMSRVFLAEDTTLDRPVVVKVLSPELAEGMSIERFAREIRVAARLQHPNIVPVLSAGVTGELPYYTMPYIEGASLRDRVMDGALSRDRAIGVLRDVARALAHAHAHGIVHRDIKPENVLLSGGVAVVGDFGVAKAIRAAVSSAPRTESGTSPSVITRLGAVVGTPAYLSPEQASGDPDVDARADIYAWALVAWELLARRHPFAGRATVHAYILAHLTEEPPALGEIVPDVPRHFAALVMRCLEKDPARRPAQAGELLAELDRALDPARGDRSDEDRVPRPAAGGSARVPAVAVLPFVNLSSDAENEFLSDGITEEIIGTLGRTRGVRVAGRASSFALKGQALDPRTVGERLRVDAVLEGSVRRAGTRMRVRAELVSAGDGFQLWSEQYDRELADVLAIEADIAGSIVAALRQPLTSLVAGAPTVRPATPPPAPAIDPRAYELYLRGRYAWNQRTAPTAADAVRYLTEAVGRAPDFASAWSALADAYLALPVYTGTSPADAWPNARAAAERALAIDPELAEARTSLAYGTMLYAWDWDAADRSFRQAIAANPEYATAHHWYGDYLAGRGRLTEALAEMERARTLDPLSRMIAAEIGWVLGMLGRADDALAQVDGLLRLDPNFAHAFLVRGIVHAGRGDFAAAVADERRALDLGGFHAHPFGVLIHATARAGDRAEAERLLADLRTRGEREHVPPYTFALALTGLGQLDEAFAWLERGVAERDELMAENFCEPLLGPLHRDPRCAPILARLGIQHIDGR